MVKIYYTPTSCGASSFICAYLSGLKYDCEVVDLATHKTESGIDFYSINYKGNVPTIILDDGTVLNENISCLEYIADQAEKKGFYLAPSNGTNERYVLRQILSFLATELHPTLGLFFHKSGSQNAEIKNFIVSILDKKMKYLQTHILTVEKNYIYGDKFTIADAYLHIILSWFGYVGLDLSKYPIAQKYKDFIFDIPEIKKARQRMATIPSTIV